MKKLYILLPLLIFITGCFNYKEINDTAIITNIAITKSNSNYKVVLKETIPKKADNKIIYDYKYYTDTNKSINQAIKSIKELSSKDIYLKQVKFILINTNIELKKLPKELKNNILVFKTNNTNKIIKEKINYKNISNLNKKKVVTLEDIRKNTNKKIPLLEVLKNELLIKY